MNTIILSSYFFPRIRSARPTPTLFPPPPPPPHKPNPLKQFYPGGILCSKKYMRIRTILEMGRWMIGSLIQSTLKWSRLLTLSRTAFRWNLKIRKIRDISPNLIYFADRNGLLLSKNVLLFYLLLISPSPPPSVVFQHRTLPSLSNICEQGWFRVQAICEPVLNQVVRIPNYWGGLRASWEEPSQGGCESIWYKRL